jgi:transposase InsO family protein
MSRHPTNAWIVQQLREAYPDGSAPRFLIFDRDGKYGSEVPIAVRSMGLTPVRTSFESPRQNGAAERRIESARYDLLDHVIVHNEGHLRRLLSEYVGYYHEDRTHLGLERETPGRRIRSMRRGRALSSKARRSASPLRPSCLRGKAKEVSPMGDPCPNSAIYNRTV